MASKINTQLLSQSLPAGVRFQIDPMPGFPQGCTLRRSAQAAGRRRPSHAQRERLEQPVLDAKPG